MIIKKKLNQKIFSYRLGGGGGGKNFFYMMRLLAQQLNRCHAITTVSSLFLRQQKQNDERIWIMKNKISSKVYLLPESNCLAY